MNIRDILAEKLTLDYIVNETEVTYDTADLPGGKFLTMVVQEISDRMDNAIDPAAAWDHMGAGSDDSYGPEGDDFSDFAAGVADDMVSRLAWNDEVAKAWLGVLGWRFEDEVVELADAKASTLDRMRVGLYVVAEKVVYGYRAAARRIVAETATA